MSSMSYPFPNPHKPGCFWYNFTEAVGGPNIKWCEETLCQFISEPANTWSNFAYLAATLIMFKLLPKKSAPHSLGGRAAVMDQMLPLLPPVVFFMGFLSFVYHLSNNYFTQLLDFLGMFAMMGFGITFNIIRAGFPVPPRRTLAGFALFMLFMTHALAILSIKFQILIVVCVVIILFTEYIARHNGSKAPLGNLFLSLLLIAVAVTFSIGDQKKWWCDPNNHVIQGHAAWHCFSALAMIPMQNHYAGALAQLKKRWQ